MASIGCGNVATYRLMLVRPRSHIVEHPVVHLHADAKNGGERWPLSGNDISIVVQDPGLCFLVVLAIIVVIRILPQCNDVIRLSECRHEKRQGLTSLELSDVSKKRQRIFGDLFIRKIHLPVIIWLLR
jgi:hypothetical protein